MSIELDDNLRSDYSLLWRTMEILPSKAPDINATAQKVIAAKNGRYKAVETATGVPWFLVGLIHQMECGGRFDQHLHNGDSLAYRTKHVPAGRPKVGDPPFTWVDSACDAVRYDGLDKNTDWSIESILYRLEAYNGWGYRRFHPDVKTPYLWSGSNHYARGKYVADGSWSSTAISGQSGAAPILKRVMELDATVCPKLSAESQVGIPVDQHNNEEDEPPTQDAADGPAFPKAHEETPSTVSTVSTSPTIWGIIFAPFFALFDGVKHIANSIGQLFNHIPGISSDVTGLMGPITNILDLLQLKSARIGIAVGLACLIVAIVRHADELQGNSDHASK